MHTTRLFSTSLALLVATAAAPALHAELGAGANRLLTLYETASSGPQSGARFGAAAAAGDFDGDGDDDLAIGAPGALVGVQAGAGAVIVAYTPTGAPTLGDQRLHQDVAGIGDVAEAGDGFGATLASGDFNGDGYADLAIAALGERLGTATGAGIVHVVYGSLAGLDASGEVSLHRGITGGVHEAGAGFGTALAVGDFDGDGYADLAIGVPGETVNGAAQAGAAVVVYGSVTGLQSGSAERWTQWQLGAVHGLDDAEAGDRLGAALAAGDFDADGRDDLAIGAPMEASGTNAEVGAVNVVLGHSSGLIASGTRFLLAPWMQLGSRFGTALASGDFDGNGAADLAIGLPDYDRPDAGAGVVFVLFSQPGVGIQPGSFDAVDQRNTGAASEAEDHVGAVLLSGDFNGDGFDDLAIAAPQEDVSGRLDCGAVSVLAGAATQPLRTGFTWHQDVPGVVDACDTDDAFGSALAAGRFTGVGLDLAIGVTGESYGPFAGAGAVHLLRNRAVFADGFATGTTAAWSSATP